MNMTRSIEKDIFVCLDCEFTGVDRDKDRIIEVAVAVFDIHKVYDTFESLIDPLCPIPEESVAIHHITEEMVQGQPTIEQVLPRLLEIIGKRTIIGHGITHDVDVLSLAAERVGVPTTIRHNLTIDTLRMARLYGQSPTNSLENLRKHFNIEPEGAHRAMSDVIVNMEVFRQLSKEYKSTSQLFDALSRPIQMRVMPLGKHKGRPVKELPLDYLLWAARMDFDQDLLFTLRTEVNRRKKGKLFTQESNPFNNL
jgi:DNA polymerase III subunit epsilon